MTNSVFKFPVYIFLFFFSSISIYLEAFGNSRSKALYGADYFVSSDFTCDEINKLLFRAYKSFSITVRLILNTLVHVLSTNDAQCPCISITIQCFTLLGFLQKHYN